MLQARVVVVAHDEKRVGGGLAPHLLFGRPSSLASLRVPAGWPAGENSFVYTKEASNLCMDVYMHEFPARFILFINMLIIQVQALQNPNTDSRDYII